MDSLEEIFNMQKELAEKIMSPRYPKGKERRISALATAIVHEAVELQRLTNWKWWKKPSDFDAELAKEELMDILHFVVQSAIELEMTPSEVVTEYRKKNQVNVNRQKEGY